MDLKDVTRKRLLSLPTRPWDVSSWYDGLFLVPTGLKHESGWGLIAIVGAVVGTGPKEIAAYCEYVYWEWPDLGFPIDRAILRTDLTWPSNIIHMWSNYVRFEVGQSLSSTTVRLVRRND